MNSDFVNILVILFIIFSIIALLVNRKTPEEETPPKEIDEKSDDYIDMSEYPRYDTKQDEGKDEIVREIETLFNKGINPETNRAEQQETPPESRSSERKEMNMPSGKIRMSPERMTKLEVNKTGDELISRGMRDIDSKIEREAKDFEMRLAHQMDTEDYTTKGIKSKLKNPKSIKEFIAISEIIGKPKALNR